MADKIRNESLDILETLAEVDFSIEYIPELLQKKNYSVMSDDLKDRFSTVCRYICSNLVPNLAKTIDELNNTLRGLKGEFIEPSVAGAPTNGRADVLPTGRNFYGVDPQTLPTKVAWEVGKARADGVIEAYIADEGKYPETIGMVWDRICELTA